ncbi:MAG: RluA family pseudouridine synthase, partial [Mycoplasmatales bacterium]
CEQQKVRVDKYIAEKLEIPRAQVSKLIDKEQVLVNQQPVKANTKVNIGDEIEVNLEYQMEVEITAEDIQIDVVYEDDDVIVINKPSGMVVHPGHGNYTGTLVNGLMYHFQTLSDVNGDTRPGIVHRIDKDTSGLLVVAKNNEAHNHLAEQFSKHTIRRQYIALVHGVVKEKSAKIDAPIGRSQYDRTKMAVTDKNSKHAVTNFEVIKRYDEYTLIRCILETGRTHQIRVHLKYINHPLVGDPAYGPKSTLDVLGQALHAELLGFIHPTTNEYMEFKAELPTYYQAILDKLKVTDHE